MGATTITRDGRELRIEAIEQRFETNFAVYNLTVAGQHTFAVGEDAVLTHNDSWCELVAKSYGKTKTELAQLRDDIAAAWGTAAGSTHGHHIVHKVGAETLSPAGKTANELSQAILTRFKIDIVADKSIASNILKNGDEFGDKLLHNLCIAPYSYVHSDDYVFAVQKMLKWAADSSTDFAKQRERVIRALGDIRTALENGQKLA